MTISQKRYDLSWGFEYYRSRCFLHLPGQREVWQYIKHVYKLRVLRGYV